MVREQNSSTDAGIMCIFLPYCISLVVIDELYGDFEDLETGEVHKAKDGDTEQTKVLNSLVTQHSDYFVLMF